MSMKNMTVAQLRTDLDDLARLYGGGIPSEQADRFNAIKAELKRRGEDPNVKATPKATPVPTKPIDVMNSDELEKELRSVSEQVGKDPTDEALQNRFADVRFEIRKRTKSDKPAMTATDDTKPMRSPLPPRGALEIPADLPAEQMTKAVTLEEVAARKLEQLGPHRWRADAAGGVVLLRHAGDNVQVSSPITIVEAEALIAQLQSALVKARAAK